MTSIFWKSALVGTLATIGLGGVASAQPARWTPGLQDGAAPMLTQVQFADGGSRRFPGVRAGTAGRGGGGFNRGGGQRYGGYGRGDHRGRGFGVGVGAGVAGLAAGAIIGGAIASQAAPAYGYGYGYDGGYAGDGQGLVDGGYAPAPVAVDPAYADADPAVGGGDQAAYCAQRFKSYDPSSGTYLGYDGVRHPCP